MYTIQTQVGQCGIQSYSETNNPWYIPVVPTGKSEFGAPNCPVRASRYHHRYMSGHPELKKGRRRLFIPVKDNYARKKLSAATISRWICTTRVYSQLSLFHSKEQESTQISQSSQS